MDPKCSDHILAIAIHKKIRHYVTVDAFYTFLVLLCVKYALFSKICSSEF